MTTFCDYMEQALYGPAGYYSSGIAKSGKAGDYFTASDAGPAFGLLLAALVPPGELAGGNILVELAFELLLTVLVP